MSSGPGWTGAPQLVSRVLPDHIAEAHLLRWSGVMPLVGDN